MNSIKKMHKMKARIEFIDDFEDVKKISDQLTNSFHNGINLDSIGFGDLQRCSQ